MSSRQIRKLQQQRELEQAKLRAQAEEEEGSEEEEVAFQPAKPSAFSAFAALQDDDANEDDDDDEDEEAPAKVVENVKSKSDDEQPAAPAKKSKKSKKKKKKAAKAKTPEKEASEEDIDAVLEALNLKDQNSKSAQEEEEEAPQFDPQYEEVCRLLGINSQHLKVANEMRNLFGRTAVEPERERERRPQGGEMQMDLETALRGRHKPGKGFPELSLKRNIFVQGKDEWPRATTGGLTMEVVDDLQEIDGTVEFKFVHSQAYEQVQNMFRQYVEMGDPQNLVGLLVRNPYNISLLLQVSKIAKNQSDHSLSNDLVERALFTFGRTATSMFGNKLKEGKARLDFARPENREFWLAGHQYIKSLIMKGTYRTAYEWAKLLLSLDPEDDPYSMQLILHHLALRAHEYKWLQQYRESLLLSKDSRQTLQIFTTPSVALAAMSLKDGKESRALLSSAMTRIPYFFTALMKELNLDPPTPFWGKIPHSMAEELYTNLFVLQTKDLWNTPEATSLLMEVAHRHPDTFNELLLSDSSITFEMARFVYLDNTPALMTLVPSKLMHRSPNSDSDPLPPDFVNNIFSWPSQQLPWQRAENEGARANMFAGHFNPIEALRQLIPGWTGDGGEADEEAINRTGLREFLERDMERLERAEREHGADDESEVNEEELRRVADYADYGSDGPPSVYSDDEELVPEAEAGNVRRLYNFLFGPREARPAGTPADGGNENVPGSYPASEGEDEGVRGENQGAEQRRE